MGPLRGTAWASNSFFHQLQLYWFLQLEVVRTYLPGTRTLSWSSRYGAWTPGSQDIPPEFVSTTSVSGTSLFSVCTPPASLNRCNFFNSIVVRLLFNSISDASEWCLTYTLVLILMWLCEEASHACLCLHVDWK